MTMTGLRVFDETLHTTHTWLHELESRLGLDDRQQAYRVLRAGLHTLRDALDTNGTARLSAQLPMLIRGIFYEGWRPSAAPKRAAEMEDVLVAVRAALPSGTVIEASEAMEQVIEVMAMHVSPGEMSELRRAMPESLRALWQPA